MSRSCRYTVKSSSAGRFAVIDTMTDTVIHDGFRDRRFANARARGLNEAVTPKAPKPIELACTGCGAVLLIEPGGTPDCPQCRRERDAVEAQIAWMETREAELQAARFSLEDIEVREFARVGERFDGLG